MRTERSGKKRKGTETKDTDTLNVAYASIWALIVQASEQLTDEG